MAEREILLANHAASSFVDTFLIQYMRMTLVGFMEWDEYINLAMVCKTTAGIVSGRTAPLNERRHFFARFVVSPLLDRAAKDISFRVGWFDSEEEKAIKAEKKAKFDEWAKMPMFTRLDAWMENYRHYGFGSPENHLRHSFMMKLVCNAKEWAKKPLVDIMNTPLTDCEYAIRHDWTSDEDKYTQVTVGSFVHRIMWAIGQFPQWVKYILTSTPDKYEAKCILVSLGVMKEEHSFGEDRPTLLLPSGLSGVFCTTKGRIDTTKPPKRLTKKLQEEYYNQVTKMDKLCAIYNKYKKNIESSAEANMLIPKIRAQMRGERPLSVEDMEMLIVTLKRASQSEEWNPKRRRTNDEDIEDE